MSDRDDNDRSFDSRFGVEFGGGRSNGTGGALDGEDV
jgi:hypothetical protein